MFPSPPPDPSGKHHDLDKEIMKIFCSPRNETRNKSIFTTWSAASPTHDGSALLVPLSAPTYCFDLKTGELGPH